MNNLEELIAVRAFEKDDTGFVYRNWLDGLRYGSDLFELMDDKNYYAGHRKVINFILSQDRTTINIACLKNDPDVNVGFSVTEGKEKLHFIFVKLAWRKFGIGKILLPKGLTTVTHVTKIGVAIMKHNEHYAHIKFKPYLEEK